MKVLVMPRHHGKTTMAIEWVREGVRAPGYPGWTRVLVMPTIDMLIETNRRWPYNQGLEDFHHRVYDWESWKNARGVNPETEVIFDEFERLFPQMPGKFIGFTITGKPLGPRGFC